MTVRDTEDAWYQECYVVLYDIPSLAHHAKGQLALQSDIRERNAVRTGPYGL